METTNGWRNPERIKNMNESCLEFNVDVGKEVENVKEDCNSAENSSSIISRLELIADDVKELKEDSSLLKESRSECRELREDKHVRSFILPICRALILVVDRARQETNRFLNASQKCNSDLPIEVLVGFRQLISARKADITEIEAVLATNGLRHFNNSSSTFNAKMQRCIKTVPVSDECKDGTISHRVLPGYLRDGQVVEPERVEVYVFDGSNRKDQ